MPKTVANPLRFGFATQRKAARARNLGEHSDEILSESGFDQPKSGAFRKAGAVA